MVLDFLDTREQIFSLQEQKNTDRKEVELFRTKVDLEPERDTGLERARQANIALADEFQNYLPYPVNLPIWVL